jgi:hypothetical protein
VVPKSYIKVGRHFLNLGSLSGADLMVMKPILAINLILLHSRPWSNWHVRHGQEWRGLSFQKSPNGNLNKLLGGWV